MNHFNRLMPQRNASQTYSDLLKNEICSEKTNTVQSSNKQQKLF